MILENGTILNREALREETEKNVLDLINLVYMIAQGRYKKLSKKNKVVINELHQGSFDSNVVIEDAVSCFDEYSIEEFNALLEDLSKKELAYIKGIAKGILLYIQALEIKIYPRGYNLLKFLVNE